MQARAAKLGAPATAFVVRADEAGLHPVRWFDASREVALCGHAALAAGAASLSLSHKHEVKLRASEGREVTVRRTEAENRYDLCLPSILTEPRDWPELAQALGGPPPQEIRWCEAGYALAVFEDEAVVRALAPDWAALAELGNIQVSVSAASAREADIVSRVFASGREDAATGSAHAALARYWLARLALQELSAFQASEAGGRFLCMVEGDQVWLGGECRVVT